MNEYINATLLKKKLKGEKMSVFSSNSDYMTGFLSAMSIIEGVIANMPTVEMKGDNSE